MDFLLLAKQACRLPLNLGILLVIQDASKILLQCFRVQEQHVVVENGTERAEGGESESELDLLAEVETESDSDDQDNAESAQRSVQTGATQGSDAGMFCSFCDTVTKMNLKVYNLKMLIL